MWPMRKCQADEVLQGVKVTEGGNHRKRHSSFATERSSGRASEPVCVCRLSRSQGRAVQVRAITQARATTSFRAEWLEAEWPRQEARHL